MKVSVMICTFGESRWRELAISRALPSAQAQKDAHEVRAWHLPKGTLAEVRNLAAADATGDALVFLDADDELAPGYVAAMRQEGAQRAGAALLVPNVQYVYRDVDGARHEDPPVSLNRGRPLLEINRAVIGTLVPRDLFLELGGFREFPAYEDWALFLACSRHVPLVDVPDAVYRVFVQQRSRNNADRALLVRTYRQIRGEYEATGVESAA